MAHDGAVPETLVILAEALRPALARQRRKSGSFDDIAHAVT